MNSFPAKSYRFATNGKYIEEGERKKEIGTWKLNGKQLTITLKGGKPATYKAVIKKIYFNRGKQYYTKFILENQKDYTQLILGPQYGDCGQYNF